MEIKQRVVRCLTNAVLLEDNPISSEIELSTKLDLYIKDSLDLIMFQMELEEEFNVKLDSDRLKRFKRLEQVIIYTNYHYVETKNENPTTG